MAGTVFNIVVSVVFAVILVAGLVGCATGKITASDFDLPILVIRSAN